MAIAAVTPSNVETESFGNTTLYVATFSGINSGFNGDTWTSNIPSVVAHWFQATDEPAQTNEGVDVALTTAATGLFTFTASEHDRDGKLYVLALI